MTLFSSLFSEMMFLLRLLLLSLPLATHKCAVLTDTGTVIGSTVYYKEKSVSRFLGIPFATPPVGNLRFKKPVPVQPWSEPLTATTFPPSCIQYYPFRYPWVDKMEGKSEDCLYLNVWAPQNVSQRSPKTVMVWLYSGGFSTGSNRLPVYDGYVIAAEGDVIVVTVNYRVGIFGFLSTDSEDAPGNMGLFDALTALEWIHRNIEAFGGDKNSITVFGQSAGSATAGFLVLSPLSKGLFRRIIMESGPQIYLEVESRRKRNFELCQKVASAVGCASNSTTIEKCPHRVVECLRKIDAETLAKTTRSFNPTSIRTFSPIFEDEFLPYNTLKAVQRGLFQDVELLTGNVKDESAFEFATDFTRLFGPYGELDPQINKSLGADLILKQFEDFDFKHDVVDHYLSNVREDDYNAVRGLVYHSLDDFYFLCPLIYFAEKVASRGCNAYYYYYYHRSNDTVFAPSLGVTHFSEVPFVFGRPIDQPKVYSEAEARLSKRMIEMWTNYAKYGVPSSTWKKFSRSEPYVEQFYINYSDDNYLRQHLENCDFYRPHYGFD